MDARSVDLAQGESLHLSATPLGIEPSSSMSRANSGPAQPLLVNTNPELIRKTDLCDIPHTLHAKMCAPSPYLNQDNNLFRNLATTDHTFYVQTNTVSIHLS